MSMLCIKMLPTIVTCSILTLTLPVLTLEVITTAGQVIGNLDSSRQAVRVTGNLVSSGAVVNQEINFNTTAGQVIGNLDSSGAVVRFLGIPFAQPFHGRRWMQAEPVQNLTSDGSPFRAMQHGLACWQRRTRTRSYNMSEDCLHLDIYAPAGFNESSNYAVMFWVHGGGFTSGANFEYDGTELAKKSVILVATNYRLGIMGNFDSNGDGIWENLALRDLKLSLEWVQSNIGSIGGDKSKVTIFGGSAGGMAVTLMAALPEFNGLFQRVISESGVLLNPKLLKRDVLMVSEYMTNQSNCSMGDIDCMSQVSAETLIREASSFTKIFNTFPVTYCFAPWQDGEIFPQNQFEDLQYITMVQGNKHTMADNMRQYDMMIGFNTNEASLVISTLRNQAVFRGYDLREGVDKATLESLVLAYSTNYFSNCSLEAAEKILDNYMGSSNIVKQATRDQGEAALNIYADLLFKSPALALADIHSAGPGNKSTYFYRFTHELQPNNRQNNPSWFRGAPHTDERMFVFGIAPIFYPPYNFTEEEIALRDTMMTAWVNFANIGDPKLNPEPWHPYTQEKQYYKLFGAPQYDVDTRTYNTRRTAAFRDEPCKPLVTTPTTTPTTTTTSDSSALHEGKNFTLAVLLLLTLRAIL